MNLRGTGNNSNLHPRAPERLLGGERRVLGEEAFQIMISLERKRSERSRKPFLLMLLDADRSAISEKDTEILRDIPAALLESTRETDVTGWCKNQLIVGVIFTELMIDDKNSTLKAILSRVTSILKNILLPEQFSQVRISFHLFPDDWNHNLLHRPSHPTLYPDLAKRDLARKFLVGTKRIMDLSGSIMMLIVSAPLFLAIALTIKLSSKGPVLFKQKRIGLHGKPFTFLKFRSMYEDSDSSIHEEYVKQLIAGQAEPKRSKVNGTGVYKLTEDSRVTPIGFLLRKSSLDELPQFINVLKGEMSLVGPRPPVPYEVEHYDLWHRRRLLEAKPGITGLWQVSGRNRIKFDDMVRLDLRYARMWSPWLDLKILFRTPRAVIQGAH
jgi:lipopolysaccharide/colanic/teichoic acid biosynthesis glycosyltransferase